MTRKHAPKRIVSLLALSVALGAGVAPLVEAERQGPGFSRDGGLRPDIAQSSRSARGDFQRRDRADQNDRQDAREERRDDRDERRDDRDERRDDRDERRDDREERRDDRRHDRDHWHVHGHIVVTLPIGHTTIVVGGTSYFYFGGVYYRSGPNGYVVVAAPVGAQLVAPPPGHTVIIVSGRSYYYYYGTYYVWDPLLGAYVVVAAPVGATVTYLPEGHEVIYVGNTRYYSYSGVYYRPHYRSGSLVYVSVRL